MKAKRVPDNACKWCRAPIEGGALLEGGRRRHHCDACLKLDKPPQPGRNMFNMDAPDLRPVKCCSPHCDANPLWIGAQDCGCFDRYYSHNEDGSISWFNRFDEPWTPEMGICNGPGTR